MSKKDLLERLTRAPSEAPREPADEAAPAARKPGVTTRVGSGVVRRRRSRDVEVVSKGDEGAGPQRRVLRRTARSNEPEDQPEAAEPAVEAPAVETESPEVPAEPVPAPEEVAAQQAAAEEVPEPTEPVLDPAVEAVQQAVEQEAAPSAAPETAPDAPAEASTDAAKPASAEPTAHKFGNYGRAVIQLPEGFDPNDPKAHLRNQDTTAATRPRGRRRVETTQPPAGRDPGFRRAGRGRGGPRQNRFERPGRPRRKKSSGPKAASPAPKAQKRKIKVDNVISVAQLAHELGVKAPVVMRHLLDLGVTAKVTEMLDIDTATLVATEFEYEVENVGFQEENFLESVEDAVEEGKLQGRPPVVTIMGHVDHGKTTLLDAIRKSRVAPGEAGGITQHIGAYQAETSSGPITFIDTPGHAAFTAMRARGAEVTDIVVLVVAADDGVQPQTLEAVNHAKAADVPIVVAVNKMDKPDVTPDHVMTQLAEQGVSPEEWGGDAQFIKVSALKSDGLDDLLEAISLQAEVLGLQANPERMANGVVLEAKMERGRGAVASVLVQRGTLSVGDHVVLGAAYGKVRAILDHRGKRLKTAGPSTPVELFGLSELPNVGDPVDAVKNEKNARTLADQRALAAKQAEQARTRRATADDLFAQAQEVERERFNVILKSDVGGSLQALKGAIGNIEVNGAEVRVLHDGIGDVSESDVLLAAANGAQIMGFNVKLDAKARQAAAQAGVEVEFYTVIYDLLDRIERELKGLLAPVYEDVRQGTVEVRQLFKISRYGTIAGSYVTDGKVGRNHTVKVMRGGEIIWEGKVAGLKRFKDDVKEVGAGFECGVFLDGFDELVEGDVLESYSKEIVEQA